MGVVLITEFTMAGFIIVTLSHVTLVFLLLFLFFVCFFVFVFDHTHM